MTRVLFLAFAVCAPIVSARAQRVRDSAGVRIVENERPTWTTAQALRLSPSRALVIGNRSGEQYELSRVRGAVRLSDGRVVVADGGSLQLRFFDSTGTFVSATGRRGSGPGEFRDITAITRMPGDTIAVIGRSVASLFTASGTFVRASSVLTLPVQLPFPRIVVALFPGGSKIVAGWRDPAPRVRGERWVDSIPVVLIDRENALLRDLGNVAAVFVEMRDLPQVPWFAPRFTYAQDERSLYLGLGNEYSVRVYAFDGRLKRIIRRRWTPTRVTSADIGVFVTEWSKRWVRETGADAEKRIAEVRDEPYATTLPAFSQFIVDRAGRLWVREPHVADAPWEGELNTLPLVPGVWSVFSTDGRWLGDVRMPARFLPKEIGRDYVLGVARDADDVETVVMYRLSGGGVAR